MCLALNQAENGIEQKGGGSGGGFGGGVSGLCLCAAFLS